MIVNYLLVFKLHSLIFINFVQKDTLEWISILIQNNTIGLHRQGFNQFVSPIFSDYIRPVPIEMHTVKPHWDAMRYGSITCLIHATSCSFIGCIAHSTGNSKHKRGKQIILTESENTEWMSGFFGSLTLPSDQLTAFVYTLNWGVELI